MLYPLLKTVHVLAAVLFLGTGLATAWYRWRADRSGDLQAIAWAQREVVIADWVFTVPSGVLLPVTGLALVHILGLSFTAPWILWGIGGYALAGILWVFAARLQIRMRDLAAAALASGAALPDAYRDAARAWSWLGIPAFGAAVATVWVMVARRGLLGIALAMLVVGGCSGAPAAPVRGDGSGTGDTGSSGATSGGSSDTTSTATGTSGDVEPYCGDGNVDPGEECDDGGKNGPFSACSEVCVINVCGDGRPLDGVEECDDGNQVDGDFCEADCTLPACGNGIPDRYELCLPDAGTRVRVVGRPIRVATARILAGEGRALVVLLDDGQAVQVNRVVDDALQELWSVPVALPRGVIVHDFDGDGTDDVVVVGGVDPGHATLLAQLTEDGAGIERTADVGSGPSDACAGDLDGDGAPDLAVADPVTGSVWMLGATGGDPPFSALDEVATATPPDFVACHDVDADGDQDVVAVAAAPGGAAGVFVLTGDGAGNVAVTEERVLAPTLLRPSLLDLEPDGDVDLVVGDPSGDRVLILPGGYVDVFGPTTSLLPGGRPVVAAALDFNASAHGDIVVATEAGELEFYIGGGAIPPQAWDGWQVGTGLVDLATGDLNGDDLRDVALAAPTTDEIVLLLSDP